MTSEELDQKIAEIRQKAGKSSTFKFLVDRAEVFPDLVADRERLKARIAELEAALGLKPGEGIMEGTTPASHRRTIKYRLIVGTTRAVP